MSGNLLGALLMMASMLCFTVNDSFIKLTDGALPLAQLLTLRGSFASLLILGLALARGALAVRIDGRGWRLLGLRCASEIGAAYFFLTALMNMPLANLTAILQALPLAVTLAAFLFLGEPIGWRRAGAILVGFIGVLLIVRPGTDGFTIWSLYALVSVVFVTARDLVTRRLPRGIPGLAVTLVTSLSVTLWFGLSSLAVDWAPVTPDLWALIAGSALFVVGGYYFSIQTMRVGEVAVVAPFRYTSLVWALLLGWFLFGDWPRPVTLLGAALVVGAGLFTFWRESRLARRRMR